MRYFNLSEFDSPDKIGSGDLMDEMFLEMLDETRHQAGIPFQITSGYRTNQHNALVGGSNGSSHTKGLAADIRCKGSLERFKIITSALEVGFTRIGVSGNFIHIDSSRDKIQNVIWTY
jgi:uncharacterized protein YcbK (DUF882 family)